MLLHKLPIALASNDHCDSSLTVTRGVRMKTAQVSEVCDDQQARTMSKKDATSTCCF